jgi:hypothetical protein
MIDNRPQADRILLAQLMGEARHHARWRELTGAEHAAAVAGLRELAAGRADLLAEVAGTLVGFHEGSRASRSPVRPRSCAVTPERIRHRYRPGSTSGASVPLRPGSRRSPVASAAR